MRSPAAFVSYAQNGEDVVLARGLEPDEHPGFWIDVGASDPIVDSVTAAFSERGWTGINVEPAAPSYRRLCEHRPRDINLHCALGRRAGFAKLYPGPGGNLGLSTLVADIAEWHYAHDTDVPAPVEVEVRTLAEVVEQYAPATVDFLKVDVEGFELDVLAGADWARFRPRAVVVEATFPETTRPSFGEWEPLLLEQGYRFVLFDGLNRYYVAPGDEELGRRLAAPANVLDGFVPHRWTTELDAAHADVERAQEHARNLEVERQALAGARADFERAQEYALALEAEVQKLARAVRLGSDRVAHSDEVAAGLREDLSALQVRAAHAMGEASRLAQLVTAIEATRTFRYTRRARAMYSLLRRFSGSTR